MYIIDEEEKKKKANDPFGVINTLVTEVSQLGNEPIEEEAVEAPVEAPVELPEANKGLASSEPISPTSGLQSGYIEDEVEDAPQFEASEYTVIDDLDSLPDDAFQSEDGEDEVVSTEPTAFSVEEDQLATWQSSPDNTERAAYEAPIQAPQPTDGERALQSMLAYGIGYLMSNGDVRVGMQASMNYLKEVAKNEHINSTSKYLYDSGYTNEEIGKWVATGKLERLNEWKPTGDGYTVINTRTGEQRLMNKTKSGQAPLQFLKSDASTGISTYKNPANGQIVYTDADGRKLSGSYFRGLKEQAKQDKLDAKREEQLLRAEQRSEEAAIRAEEREKDREARKELAQDTRSYKEQDKLDEKVDKQRAIITKADGTLEALDNITDEDISRVSGVLMSRLPTARPDSVLAEGKVAQIAGMVTSQGMETLRGLGAASDRDVAVITRAGSALFDEEGKLRKGLSEQAVKDNLEIIRKQMQQVKARAESIINSGKAPTSDNTKASPTSSGDTQFVRTGTVNGRKVGELPDGRVVYIK